MQSSFLISGQLATAWNNTKMTKHKQICLSAGNSLIWRIIVSERSSRSNISIRKTIDHRPYFVHVHFKSFIYSIFCIDRFIFIYTNQWSVEFIGWVVIALAGSSGGRWLESSRSITKMWWFQLPLRLTVKFHSLGCIKVGHLPLSG